MKGDANERSESFVEYYKNEYLYLRMELMQKNLRNMLKEKKEVSYVFFIDIMLET